MKRAPEAWWSSGVIEAGLDRTSLNPMQILLSDRGDDHSMPSKGLPAARQ